MSIDVLVIWFVIIVFATLMTDDGFDLGIGMLFSVVHDGEERDVMAGQRRPVWDVTKPGWCSAGQGLFGAFPLAYAVITDALVIPLGRRCSSA